MQFFHVIFGEARLARVAYSSSFSFRLKGLLGRSELPPGEGLWLAPCTSIHMFFMRFPIDAIFLDRHLRILAIYPAIKPWRISGFHPTAHGVLELPAGTAAQHHLSPGCQIQLVPEAASNHPVI